MPSEEAALAARLLRLLLDKDGGNEGALVWHPVLLPLARRNGVLLRVAERFGEPVLPGPVTDAIASERRRARDAFALVRHVSRICTEHGIEYLFAKAFQHYPDVGGDLDLLVLARPAAVDALLARELSATVAPRDLAGRISGSVTFRVRDGLTPLDVHHGRIGTVGEHRAYAVMLVRNHRRVMIEGAECGMPWPEDQLVLQGVQRISGRRTLRLCDVVSTITALRDPLDWAYVISLARRVGVLPGLGCYLSYVEQLHDELFGCPLLPERVRDHLPLAGWGRVAFVHGAYRFPALRVNAKLYLKQLITGLRAANWESAARLCLLPLLGAAVAVGRVATPAAPSVESA